MKQLPAGACQSTHDVVRDLTGSVHVMGSKPGTPVYDTTTFTCSLGADHDGDHGYQRGSFMMVRWPRTPSELIRLFFLHRSHHPDDGSEYSEKIRREWEAAQHRP